MKILINEREIEILEKESLYTGNANSYSIEVEFTNEMYKDFLFYLTFKNNDVKKKVLLMPNNKVTIPYEVLKNAGDLVIGFYATKDDENIIRYSSNIEIVTVNNGAYDEEATYTEELTPSILDQYLQEMRNFYEESKKQFEQEVIESAKAFNEIAQEKIDTVNRVAEEVNADKVEVENMKASVEMSEQNAKASETKSKEYLDEVKSNSTQALTEFNNNADTKMANYNSNATAKLNEYNANYVAKTTEFDTNFNNKMAEINEASTSIEQERIESDKRYTKAIETDVITITENGQVNLDEEGYMKEVYIESNLPEITQETTPTIDAPSNFQKVVKNVNVSNSQKNILPVSLFKDTFTINGLTFEKTNYGYLLNGTCTNDTAIYLFGTNLADTTERWKLNAGTYTFQSTIDKLSLAFTYNGKMVFYLKPTTFNEEQKISGLRCQINQGVTFTNEKLIMQVAKEAVETDIVQYNGYSKTIPLQENQFLGSFNGFKNYIEDGVLKSNLKLLTLTGDENWQMEKNLNGYNRFAIGASNANIKAKILKQLSNYGVWDNMTYNYGTESHFWLSYEHGGQFFYTTNRINSVEEWKIWLKERYNEGNPLQVLYATDTEETESLPEINSLQLYNGLNDITCNDCILKFKANRNLQNYIQNEIVENNKVEREISDNKYPRALKTKLEETNSAIIYAENDNIENLIIKGEEITQATTPTLDSPSKIEVTTNIDILIASENKFNKNTVINGFINNDGTITNRTDFFVGDFIPIKPNTFYTTSKDHNDYLIMGCYDKNKNFINQYINRTNLMIHTFKMPENVAYIRITDNERNLDHYQLEEGSFKTPYKEFCENIYQISLPEEQFVGKVKEYANYIDKNGLLHKNIEKIVVTGDDIPQNTIIVDFNSNCIIFKDIAGSKNFNNSSNLLCNMFSMAKNWEQEGIIVDVRGIITILIKDGNYGFSSELTKEELLNKLKVLLNEKNLVIYGTTKNEYSSEKLDDSEIEKIKKIKLIDGFNNVSSNSLISFTYNKSLIRAFEEKDEKIDTLQAQIDEIKTLLSSANTASLLAENLAKDNESEVM